MYVYKQGCNAQSHLASAGDPNGVKSLASLSSQEGGFVWPQADGKMLSSCPAFDGSTEQWPCSRSDSAAMKPPPRFQVESNDRPSMERC
jgi:hypothetical protein